MRALVTGGAGFIGHHLVAGLLDGGHGVNVIDDLSTGMLANLAPFLDRVTLVEGSVLDEAALDEAIAGCEIVFHEAAIASVVRSIVEPCLTNDVNVGGTIEVMLAAARHGVRRVILAGSSAVYGVPVHLPCRETDRPAPLSPYGVSKLAAEQYVHTLGEPLGVETVVLRYFNVFGPGQDPNSEYAAVVPRFVTAVLEDRRPVVNGSGEISRDYVYVEDVVRANVLAASPGAPSRLTCNIAAGSRHSLLDLLDAICEAAGRIVDPIVGPTRAGDIEHSGASIRLAREALGYRAAVPFREGIGRTVRWYREGAIRDATAPEPRALLAPAGA